MDFQVFQRQTTERGVVRVTGRVAYESEALEARLTGPSLEGDWMGQWESLRPDVEGDGFSGDIKAPAGGWYRLEVRAKNAGKVIGDVAIEHVGIGEVFVGAGQSNSTNYGSEPQRSSTGMVASFSGKLWQVANDPQPGTQDNSTGGSFWPALGDALAEKYHVPIGVAVTGCGSTSVREWLPKGVRFKQPPTTGRHVKPAPDGGWESTGQLFEGLIRRVAQLGPNGFRAILWHQGESDAGQARGGHPDSQITGDQYREFMQKLIEASREKAGWKMPWFVAEATYHSEQDPSDDEFRAAQKSLWGTGVALPGPDTDALGAEYRKGVHFNAKGLQAHGKAWAEKVSAYLDKALSEEKAP